MFSPEQVCSRHSWLPAHLCEWWSSGLPLWLLPWLHLEWWQEDMFRHWRSPKPHFHRRRLRLWGHAGIPGEGQLPSPEAEHQTWQHFEEVESNRIWTSTSLNCVKLSPGNVEGLIYAILILLSRYLMCLLIICHYKCLTLFGKQCEGFLENHIVFQGDKCVDPY